MSLESGRLAKYEADLCRNLENEEVMGVHSDDVNEIDVKGWGVAKFGYKKFLRYHNETLCFMKAVTFECFWW